MSGRPEVPTNMPTAPAPEREDTPTPTAKPPRLVGGLFAGPARHAVRLAVRSGALREVASRDILAPAELPAMASFSLWLFLLGGLGFSALDAVALRAHPHTAVFAGFPLILWLGALALINLVAYVVMLPIHEAIHATVILALGGRPRFGIHWPVALYCTAPGQLFPRRAYQIVALAPLVVLTLVGIVLTWLVPASGLLLWLAWVGNVSGAAGDLVVNRAVGQLPPATLIADTATGYTAYQPDQRQG